MGYRIMVAIMAYLVGALLVTGCADSAPLPSTGASATPSGEPAPSPAAIATPTATPADRPLRILSLTPNVTEILFAMGLGDKVVGRSTYCNYPPEAAALPAVGDTLKLNQEKIIALRPTVAFLITSKPDLLRTFEAMGLRAVPLRSDRMDELWQSVATIGRETGRPDAARALTDRCQAGLDKVRRRVAGLPRPKTLFAFPMTIGSPQMMVAARGTFVDELIQAAGAENAYPDRGTWPTVSAERVIAMAPEVVIINAAGDDGAPDRVEVIRRAWARWTSVPAVTAGRVVILTESYLTIPGPRVGLAAARLAEVIHPESAPPAGAPAAPAAGAPAP